jgi:hypothetical protein
MINLTTNQITGSIGENEGFGDIKHWYSKVAKTNDIQPESSVFPILERLDIQRTGSF